LFARTWARFFSHVGACSRAEPRASTQLLAVVLTTLTLVWFGAAAHAQAPAQPAAPPPAADPAAAPTAAPAQAAPPPVYAPPPAGYVAQPVYAQPYAYAPQPPPPRRPRLRKGLMISGISVFGASYIIAAITGAVLLDIKTPCSDCKGVGAMLLIPLAGPFLAIPRADAGDGGLVVLGIVQIAGAGLMVGGIIQFLHSKRQAQQSGYYSLDLAKGRLLSFDLHTSPARLGPSMQLRF
jgi:hypothetical protein